MNTNHGAERSSYGKIFRTQIALRLVVVDVLLGDRIFHYDYAKGKHPKPQ